MKSEFSKKITKNPLAAFALNPASLRFEDGAKDEYVALILRRHSATITPWIILGILFLLLPPVLGLFGLLQQIPFFSELSAIQQGFIILIWYLLTIGFIFENFLTWYFHVYIVTNKRVVDINFKGILVKTVTEAQLDKIQDVSQRVSGLFPILFNYGTVTIQTASEIQQINFEKVPKPNSVQRLIGDMIEKGEA